MLPWPNSGIQVKKDATVNETPEFAYVTLLLGSGDWWKGVMALQKSLRHVHCSFPLIALVGVEVPEKHLKVLRESGVITVVVDHIKGPTGSSTSSFAVQYYEKLYTKIRMWDLHRYKKLIYLDADCLVLQNIDHLFWKVRDEKIGGVLDCFCESKKHPASTGSCQVLVGRRSPYINAGMLVFTPNHIIFKELLQMLSGFPTPLAEQDFINYFFASKIQVLPVEYNLQLPYLRFHKDLASEENVKVVHFSISGAKPWDVHLGKEYSEIPAVQGFLYAWKKIFEV